MIRGSGGGFCSLYIVQNVLFHFRYQNRVIWRYIVLPNGHRSYVIKYLVNAINLAC